LAKQRIGRTKITAARKHRIVPNASSTGSAMEIFVLREILADKFAADDGSIMNNDATVRLVWEHHLSDTGGKCRVEQSRNDSKNNSGKESRSNIFFQNFSHMIPLEFFWLKKSIEKIEEEDNAYGDKDDDID
jgi:hypothetical protein